MQESVSGENPNHNRRSGTHKEGAGSRNGIPHPNKVMFPDVGLRRIDLIAYYETMSTHMLPYLKDRALTLIRWPQGIGGPHFYQRHPTPHTAILIPDQTTMLYWVARGALEIHAPLGLATNPLYHDWAVLDLDPSGDLPWAEVREATHIVADCFNLCGIPFGVKTSGNHGIHFFIRITPTIHTDTVYWMHSLATLLKESFPDTFTVERLKVRRGTRIYLDYLQNGHTRTMAAIYSLRATSMASVSTPVNLADLHYPPEHWTPDRVVGRRHFLDTLWESCADPVDLGRILTQRKLLIPKSGI